MKDKFKRFTIAVFDHVSRFCITVWFLYGLCLLADTKIMIFHAIIVIFFFVLLVSTIAGIVFIVIDFVQKCITKKAAANPDPDELQL